jgi:hypothetical protein
MPGFHHPSPAEFRILHLEKRGLHFRETTISEYRDGRAFVWRNDRRLFQYCFERQAAWTALAETSPVTFQRAREFRESRIPGNLQTPLSDTLRSWNSEAWYVVLNDSRLLAFRKEQTAPPREVIELFHQIENLPLREDGRFAVRDVCLGFCYDPTAALGFEALPQRVMLLARSSANSSSDGLKK